MNFKIIAEEHLVNSVFIKKENLKKKYWSKELSYYIGLYDSDPENDLLKINIAKIYYELEAYQNAYAFASEVDDDYLNNETYLIIMISMIKIGFSKEVKLVLDNAKMFDSKILYDFVDKAYEFAQKKDYEMAVLIMQIAMPFEIGNIMDFELISGLYGAKDSDCLNDDNSSYFNDFGKKEQIKEISGRLVSMGAWSWMGQNYEKAKDFLKKSVLIDPLNDYAYRLLIRFYMEQSTVLELTKCLLEVLFENKKLNIDKQILVINQQVELLKKDFSDEKYKRLVEMWPSVVCEIGRMFEHIH